MNRNRSNDHGGQVLTDAFDSAAIALGVLGTEGKLLYANSAWMGEAQDRHIPAMLQSRPGTNCLDALRAAAKGGNYWAARVLSAFERVVGGATQPVRCEFFEAGAEPHWFDLSLTALHSSRGIVISSMDVTTRKRAVAVTASQIDELARYSRASTMSLFAAAAGHELNQPLAAVLANADAALRDLRAKAVDDPSVREYIINISNAATRATEIIHRMRRLLSGGSPDRDEVDINQLVCDVALLVSDDARQKDVRIETTLDTNRPIIFADAIQLQQALINLLHNAIDVSVQVAAAERKVEVVTVRHASHVELRVDDNGPALEDNALARIFEPGYTTKRFGMGLGLYITRAIVESHGGSINAYHRGDHGLSMRILVPSITHGSLDQMLSAFAS